MNERSFIAELKCRNVYKVAAAHVVVAWLFIQLASILVPTFEAHPWVMKVCVALTVLGSQELLKSATASQKSVGL